MITSHGQTEITTHLSVNRSKSPDFFQGFGKAENQAKTMVAHRIDFCYHYFVSTLSPV
jgi:hypothetical protein